MGLDAETLTPVAATLVEPSSSLSATGTVWFGWVDPVVRNEGSTIWRRGSVGLGPQY
jgi:hypothetical protein